MTVLTRGAADLTRFAGANPNYMPTASLTTPTYDGSGQTTEPTYRYFPQGKLGYKHWLAHNPLPNGSSAYENPCILVSNDRVTWMVPPGATMPIEPTPSSGSNSDCFLLFDPKSSNIYMYWNTTGMGPGIDGVYYRVSTDAVTWGAKQSAIIISGFGDGGAVLEPKVVYDAPRNRYAMFTIGSGMQVQFASAPTGPWSRPTSANNCTLTPATTIWHMDIITIPDGRFLMVFCDNANQNNRKGYLATSSDGINWRVGRQVLAANAWAIKGPYRPSIQPALSGNGYDIIVAYNQTPQVALGLATNIPLSEIP